MYIYNEETTKLIKEEDSGLWCSKIPLCGGAQTLFCRGAAAVIYRRRRKKEKNWIPY